MQNARHLGARRRGQRRRTRRSRSPSPVLLRTGDERYPSYSPDGTQIAFRGDLDLAEPSGDEEIYVDERRRDERPPAHEQRGLRLGAVVVARRQADRSSSARRRARSRPATEAQEKDIYVMRADGTHVRRLTDSPGLDEGPELSPDGTKIAFSSARDGQQEIYVMDADGCESAAADRQPGARRVARLAGAAVRRPRPPGVRRRLARLRRRVERAGDAGPVPRGAPDRAALERGRRRGRAAGAGCAA